MLRAPLVEVQTDTAPSERTCFDQFEEFKVGGMKLALSLQEVERQIEPEGADWSAAKHTRPHRSAAAPVKKGLRSFML